MSVYQKMNKEELAEEKKQLLKEYEAFKAEGNKLVMTRGVPATAQLDLSLDMLSLDNYISPSGVDCRNYGGLEGLKEMREMFAELLDVKMENVLIGGNSSLTMMHDTISRFMLLGVPGVNKPWCKEDKIKFICPAPGYDRHFSVTQLYGIELLLVDMTENGPDMNQVKALVENDASVKGMWCVPKFSNPEGIVYSDETVKELATMKTAAEDFIIMWDNAYAFHHLGDDSVELANIFDYAKEAGTENRIFEFVSTSKITFAGAGVAALITSVENLETVIKQVGIQTIGPDKLNQLRHLKFFKNAQGLKDHMKKHAEILRPKFDVVIDVFEKSLGGMDIASWTNPRGGYFINLKTLEGCADRVVKLSGEAGVALTAPAGSAFPYKKDPRDCNIRISPSFPSLEDLEKAMKLVAICVKIASIEKLEG